MRIETLKERIENAKAKIEKKTATIEKKAGQIEKKLGQLAKMGYADGDRVPLEDNPDGFWLTCDVKTLREDIARGEREIAEARAALRKYEEQLEDAEKKDVLLANDIPENVKRMQAELVVSWNKYDKARRDRLRAEYKEVGYKAFFREKKRTRADYAFKDLTNEQIERQNDDAAKALILNLISRVRGVVGTITDWSGIHATIGTWGGTVLNGTVHGTEGSATIESIYAGGYNIQRLHVRVLVKPW